MKFIFFTSNDRIFRHHAKTKSGEIIDVSNQTETSNYPYRDSNSL